MKELIVIMMTVILVDNFVLSQFLGICPFLGVSKKMDSAKGMGIAVTFVMFIATAVTWPIQKYLLERYDVEYLQTLVFILIIASLVQLVEVTLKKYIPPLYKSLGIYLPLITTNCAVLGVTIMNINEEYTYLQSLSNTLGAGLGFLLAMVLFSGVRKRLEDSTMIPEAFRGIPITLVSASLLSVAFMGFGGIVEGIFL